MLIVDVILTTMGGDFGENDERRTDISVCLKELFRNCLKETEGSLKN
jgi:hypothetical protein